MSNFTVIFTELPLYALNLECLISQKDLSKSSWMVGKTEIDWGFSKKDGEIIHRIYPDMNMYSSDYSLNSDMIDFASEYLDRGYQIIFIMLQAHNYPPREDMEKWVIDLDNRPSGKMPVVMNKELEPKPFNIYRFIKTRRSVP